MEHYMRAVIDMLPNLAGKTNRSDRQRSYTRPLAVAALLIVVYLLLRLVPVDAGEDTGGQHMEILLLWCSGGFVTLAFLAFAARRS